MDHEDWSVGRSVMKELKLTHSTDQPRTAALKYSDSVSSRHLTESTTLSPRLSLPPGTFNCTVVYTLSKGLITARGTPSTLIMETTMVIVRSKRSDIACCRCKLQTPRLTKRRSNHLSKYSFSTMRSLATIAVARTTKHPSHARENAD